MGKVLLKFLVGGVAGLLAWAILEPFKPSLGSNQWATWETNLMLALGCFVGAAVGGLDGFTRGGKLHTLRGIFGGLFFGAIGATLGHGVGGGLAGAFGGTGVLLSGSLPARMIVRTVAFIPIGAFLGAGIGASSMTLKRAIQGATGGAIGAGISGAVFDLIGTLTSGLQGSFGGSVASVDLGRGVREIEVGGPSRAISTLLMGAAIGLFIGLVELLTRSAWVRLTLGRNEGKEWPIDSAQTFLGRSETAQIPLFGDPNIAAIHASIQKQGHNYYLVDGGTPMGTGLNGQRIQNAQLNSGDVIQIGSFNLQFLLKGSPAPARMGEPYARQGYPISGNAAAAPMTPVAPVAQPPGSLWGQTSGQPAAPSQPTQMYAQPVASNPTVAYAAPAAAPGMPFLAVLDGPLAGQRVPVHGAVEIGREGSGLAIGYDQNASRRHAQVTAGPSGIAVNDMGSTNGTFVNGQRVQTAQLKPGDTIKIGNTSFRLEVG